MTVIVQFELEVDVRRAYARHIALLNGDAGIEQEAFKVLERAPSDVDWQVVERINQAAQQAWCKSPRAVPATTWR